MSDSEGAATVVAVLLADGWHQIVPGSFSLGPLALGGRAEIVALLREYGAEALGPDEREAAAV